MRRRRIGALSAIVALLVALLVALPLALLLAHPSVLHAHAMLLRSTPAAGAHLPASPARVSLVFSEELEPALARLSLLFADGTRRSLDAASDPHDVHVLAAPIGDPLPPGGYRIVYRVVSADGHPVQGSVPFTVGELGASSPPVPADTSAQDAATTWGPAVAGAPLIVALLRGLAVAALMALAGLLALLLGDRAPADEAVRAALRVAGCLSAAAAVLSVAHLAAWIANVSTAHQLTSDAISAAVEGSAGRTELARAALGVLCAWALLLARRPALALAFAAGALVASAMAGHAAAVQPAWAIPAKSLHLFGAACWLGSVLWLLLLLAHDQLDARQAGRASTVALGGALVVTASGAVQALLFVESPRTLMHGAYGAVLLAKVVGLLVLLGYGAWHRWRALPRALGGEGERVAITLRQEIAVLVVVTLLGGLLACIPPNPPRAAPPASLPSPAS